jgi:hypothetical protein
MAVTDVWCHVTVFEPSGSPLGSWTLRGAGAPGLGDVDHIARIQLAARSIGATAVLTDVAPRLRELLALAGLTGLLGEPGGQPEGREDLLDVEERVEPGDPAG